MNRPVVLFLAFLLLPTVVRAEGSFENDREEVSWKTLRTPKLLCLDAVGDGLDFSPES